VNAVKRKIKKSANQPRNKKNTFLESNRVGGVNIWFGWFSLLHDVQLIVDLLHKLGSRRLFLKKK
jgi:hypothetical protein